MIAIKVQYQFVSEFRLFFNKFFFFIQGEFTKLFFTSDWATVKSAFLKLYTLPFVENKKKELNVNFDESESLLVL